MVRPHRLLFPAPLRTGALLAAFALLTCFAREATAADRVTGHAFATRSEVLATHGMAATSQPLATLMSF